MRYSPLIILATLSLPFVAFAADPSSLGFTPLTSIPGIEQAGNSATLPDFLNNVYRLAIGAAAVLAVLQIVRAGIMYMGGDSVTEKKEARSLITLAIGGLVLVLSPVIVFSIVNPDILSLKIGGLDKLATPTASTTANTGLGGGAIAPTSVIPATGAANTSCKHFADGDVIQSNNYAEEQCCGNQTSATVSCQVQSKTNKDFSMTEYCACHAK